ncbi:MAG: glucosyltransferase domain-containing protein [Lachnospiraceae bacterium]|nr:glucosyltransferase domain-containing protein [Lachnospiraceae bacterium]
MKWTSKIKKEYKVAFLSAFFIGLLIHMPVMLSDIPNHDGLSSLYFDQNMITSGRWFLTIACGFSTYYTIPWVIGLLGLVFLGLTSVALAELLEIQDTVPIMLISGLLVSFPALASTFAYVFTMDGYMLALLLAVLSVLCTKKWRKGFWIGAFCLAFSMGTYQAYLPFAILLCLYEALRIFGREDPFREKCWEVFRYLCMGVLGVLFYYVILRILLVIEGKELDSYQGINDGISGAAVGTITHTYRDFLSFTLRGNVLFQNIFSLIALIVLCGCAIYGACRLGKQRKVWKNPALFVIITMVLLAVPLATNVILLISPNVTYHLLMRYQWVVYLILMVAFVSRHGEKKAWIGLAAAFVLVFHYALVDNIGYTNLQKRYEKTYAYCVRLLDRIEQTEGYYQGIPIAMVGVVGYEPFPVTDITLPVTSNMIGLNGDTLLYTAENYEAFIRNYLGASLNIMTPKEMGDIYYSEEYIEMESFPAASSVKLVDGIIYVKTENVGRD